MSYEAVSHFVQTWGLVFFVVAFAIVVAYALWPGNRARFKKAARMPLEEDDAGESAQREQRKDAVK